MCVLGALPILRDLLASGACQSLTEAAYRYCRYEPGLDVVLAGTGSADHLLQKLGLVVGQHNIACGHGNLRGEWVLADYAISRYSQGATQNHVRPVKWG